MSQKEVSLSPLQLLPFRCTVRTSKTEDRKKRFKGSTMLLHDGQKLDDDFGRRLDKHLPLTPLLSIEHILQRIVQNTDSHHRVLPATLSTQPYSLSSDSQISPSSQHQTKTVV